MSQSSPNDEARAHVQAFLWLAGLVGAFGTVAGLLAQDGGEILNAIGVIGGTAMLVDLGLARIIQGPNFDKPTDERVIILVSLVIGLAAYFLFPWPTDETSRNQMKIVGVIVLVLAFLVGVGLYRESERKRAPAQKVCPDCANSILVAAKVCQHCGYRFQPAA